MKSHGPHPSTERHERIRKLIHRTTTTILVWVNVCDCDKEDRYLFREAGLAHSYAYCRMHSHTTATTIYTQ